MLGTGKYRTFDEMGHRGWTCMRGQAREDEVVAWIGGIANSIPTLSAQRQNLPLGFYIIDASVTPEPA